MRFSGGPEIDFPRAAACTVSLLSVLFHSLLLSGGAQSLLNSNVSLPFLSVLTGRGYSLGGSVGAGSGKCWPEASITGIGACPKGGSTNSGRAGRGAVAVAETSPGPGSGIKLASGPGGALGGRRVIIQHGGEVRSSLSKSCRIPFLSSVNFCAINVFPFSFWIQNLVQVGGSQANPGHESIDGY